MSLKINMMVKHLVENNKNYDIIKRSVIKNYLKEKFKCSDYMANKAIKKAFEK